MSSRDYELGVVDAQRSARLARGNTGFSKETKELLKTTSGKYLMFCVVFLCITIGVLVIALGAENKNTNSDKDKYRNIALIVGYSVFGITIGRSLYFYTNPREPETARIFLWYLFMWPFYLITSTYKFFATNNSNDFMDMVFEFIGYSKLPPYPTYQDKFLNVLKVITRITILVSFSLVIHFMLTAEKGTKNETEQHKDSLVLLVVMIVLSFMLFTPDVILDSKNWQYRTAIFFTAFFFLYSLYLYMLGSYHDYDSDKKYAMGIAAIASGVLLLSLCLYYFMYKLPDDEKNRMLRGIFTEEQMMMIDSSLAKQVSLLDQIIRDPRFFDNDDNTFKVDEKTSEKLRKELTPQVINLLGGKTKSSIENTIDNLRQKFTDIYKAKLVYRLQLGKYLDSNKQDRAALNNFINSAEFRKLESDTLLNHKATEFRQSVQKAMQLGSIPPPEDYQKMFGVDTEPVGTNEVTLPEALVEEFESKVESVDQYLMSAYNRALYKALIQKYNDFVASRDITGVASNAFASVPDSDNISIRDINETGRENIARITDTITKQSRLKLERTGFLKEICDNNMKITKSDNEQNFQKIFDNLRSNEEKEDSNLKEVLGSGYVKPMVNAETIIERLNSRNIFDYETAWNDKLLRKDIQKLSENRLKNAKKAYDQSKEYYSSLVNLIKKVSPAAQGDELRGVDVLKQTQVKKDLKILNRGIGETRDFKSNSMDDLLEQAKLEAERYRTDVERAYRERERDTALAKEDRDRALATSVAGKDLTRTKEEVIFDVQKNIRKAIREQLGAGKMSSETKKALQIPESFNGKIDDLTLMEDSIISRIKGNEFFNDRPTEAANIVLKDQFRNFVYDARVDEIDKDQKMLFEEYFKEKDLEGKRRQAKETEELLRAEFGAEKEKYELINRINEYNRKWNYTGPPILDRHGNPIPIIAKFKSDNAAIRGDSIYLTKNGVVRTDNTGNIEHDDHGNIFNVDVPYYNTNGDMENLQINNQTVEHFSHGNNRLFIKENVQGVNYDPYIKPSGGRDTTGGFGRRRGGRGRGGHGGRGGRGGTRL